MNDMKTSFLNAGKFAALTLILAMNVQALDIEEIHLPLTRSYADQHFSKNYHFIILEDNSVRRIWREGSKTITIDFDIKTEQALSIFVEYHQVADKMQALTDMKMLTEGTREDNSGWKKIKSGTTSKIGIGDCRLMRLKNGAMIFWENSENDGCKRLCWFASKPDKDRMQLTSAMETTGHTALGKVAGSGAFKRLWDDERRRQKMEVVKPQTPKPTEQAEKNTAAPEPKVTPVPPTIKMDEFGEEATTETVVIKNDSKNLLDVLGIKADNETIKWVLLGVSFVVLLVISNMISAARKKARQQAAFEALLQRTSPPRRKKK